MCLRVRCTHTRCEWLPHFYSTMLGHSRLITSWKSLRLVCPQRCGCVPSGTRRCSHVCAIGYWWFMHVRLSVSLFSSTMACTSSSKRMCQSNHVCKPIRHFWSTTYPYRHLCILCMLPVCCSIPSCGASTVAGMGLNHATLRASTAE